ncbi:MAG TPA: molybdopterin-dependent oxidoreductase [Pyrinomonadaceae bacterium]|nr:molybdopterin-dependent oxidoreductase [Pyrinomonadaceae bacterium]
MTTNNSHHYRACNLCEAICGIEISVQPDNRLDIRGDKEDPLSRGYICPKAVALQDLYYDKDRLKHPVRRTPNGWERIGWNEAFDEVAQNLKRIQASYGKNSIGSYLGNPNVHNFGALLFAPAFIRSLRTRNRFSATSVDQLAHHVAAYFMFGHQLLLPVPDIDRTKFFLILGANPVVSNGSMMTAPGMSRRIKEIRERGGKVILVDPRFNETARLADRHLFIRPGTDVLLLLALLHVVFEEGLTRLGELESFTTGLESIGRLVSEFAPEKVASITGIDAEQVRLLAREFSAAESAVCYGRIGVSTQEFGGVCQWLINVLNTVTGNLDRAGGAMFTLPAFDPLGVPESMAPRGSYARRHSRVRKLPEFAGEFPVVALAEEILTEGEGQIKALVTVAGNPVLSTPNGRLLDQALGSLEFMVSIDPYINETTRHANIILPPTSPLEREHYDLVFHLLAVRNTAKFSPYLFQRPADARHDWEILVELQTRMAHGRIFGSAKRNLIKRFFGPERILDLGLRLGPYGPWRWHGRPAREKEAWHGRPAREKEAWHGRPARGLTLRKLKKAPHGIDLGPLRPCLPARLRTPDKRIDLAPEILLKDVERVKAKFPGNIALESNGNLLLIGRRQLRSNNSWMHNSERLVKGQPGKSRCTILMHPADAAHRGLKPGQEVSVQSNVGSVELPIEITEEMMPGVVSIPHGWGHDRLGVQLDVAQQHAGASINDLTDSLAIDTLCGTAAFNGTLVEVDAVKSKNLATDYADDTDNKASSLALST